jgi:hypothetical protein
MNQFNEADDADETESTGTATRVPPDGSEDDAGPDPIGTATRVP